MQVRDRLAYLDKFKNGFEYGDWIVRGDGKHISGHIQDVLTKIQARLQWGSDKYACTEVERLSAEQNCEVVIAADEYLLRQTFLLILSPFRSTDLFGGAGTTASRCPSRRARRPRGTRGTST